jgi:benzoyl-CoA reductase/2-hydroxyglutaryl-CoA dehydratase subunit BcrC/BadD/HgdB
MASRLNSEAFERFARATAAVMNPEVERWKEEGGRVIGYFSDSLPGEMITAAGMLPVRLRATGSRETDLSDSYFGPSRAGTTSSTVSSCSTAVTTYAACTITGSAR